MRLTSKGQVTIPLHIRKKLGLSTNSEVEFVEEKGRVIVKKGETTKASTRFRKLRGIGKVQMTTDEILRFTRGDR